MEEKTDWKELADWGLETNQKDCSGKAGQPSPEASGFSRAPGHCTFVVGAKAWGARCFCPHLAPSR